MFSPPQRRASNGVSRQNCSAGISRRADWRAGFIRSPRCLARNDVRLRPEQRHPISNQSSGINASSGEIRNMMSPDILNGLFEFSGTLFVLLNVRTIYRAKKLVGFNPSVLVFFTSWGFWNLFYYPHLGQIFSAIASGALCAANLTYTILAIKYREKKGIVITVIFTEPVRKLQTTY